jgi:hypothetical protein
MGAEDGDRVRGNLGQILDEMRPLGLQTLHHVFVVDDLMTHVDRRAVFLQSALDDLDGTHDTGAKTARLGKYYFHQRPPGGCRTAALRRKSRGRPPSCSLSNTLATTP